MSDTSGNISAIFKYLCKSFRQDPSLSVEDKEVIESSCNPYFTETTSQDMELDNVCHQVETNLLANKISTLFISFFIVFGVIGNVISCIVFSKKAMVRYSSTVYLKWLAVTDSLYLITVLTSHTTANIRCFYFRSFWFLDIFNSFEWVCKIFQFQLDFFSDFSTCIVLIFTVERFLAVYKPLFYRTFCTSTRASRICKCVMFVIFCSDFPAHAFLVGFSKPEIRKCSIIKEYEDTFYILYAMESLAFKVLPVILATIFNILIVCRLTSTEARQEERERGKQTN